MFAGQMIYVDLESGKFMENTSIAREVATRNPYGEWLSESTWLKDIAPANYLPEPIMENQDLIKLQSSHGESLDSFASCFLEV